MTPTFNLNLLFLFSVWVLVILSFIFDMISQAMLVEQLLHIAISASIMTFGLAIMLGVAFSANSNGKESDIRVIIANVIFVCGYLII